MIDKANGVFVGIDTSNYTTSVAICSEDGVILANLKAPLPVEPGARGLRQSDALFHHVKNLPGLMEQLHGALGGKRILAVGCSAKPRDAEGSYMPCFLAGCAAAEAVAAGADVPVYRFSHQNGHLMAAAYSSGASELLCSAPFGAFHVSGGTTELLRVIPGENGFSVTLLGGTADLNAGQVIDRIGVKMGLPFPSGRSMEEAATSFAGIPPAPRASVRGWGCHLSGLENLAEKLYAETGDRAVVSVFVLESIAKTLNCLTETFRKHYPDEPVLYAGGVMSNRLLQARLGRFPGVYFSEPQFSADNAAGTALLCRNAYRKEKQI